MFSTPSKIKFVILRTLILSSANAFNLDQSKILSFSKELNMAVSFAATVIHSYHSFDVISSEIGRRS